MGEDLTRTTTTAEKISNLKKKIFIGVLDYNNRMAAGMEKEKSC